MVSALKRRQCHCFFKSIWRWRFDLNRSFLMVFVELWSAEDAGNATRSRNREDLQHQREECSESIYGTAVHVCKLLHLLHGGGVGSAVLSKNTTHKHQEHEENVASSRAKSFITFVPLNNNYKKKSRLCRRSGKCGRCRGDAANVRATAADVPDQIWILLLRKLWTNHRRAHQQRHLRTLELLATR